MIVKIIGFIAGTLTSLAFIPQVYRAFKTKKVDDLSYAMAILYWIGICLWLVYGIAMKDAVLTFANCISITLSTLLIIAKVKYHEKN